MRVLLIASLYALNYLVMKSEPLASSYNVTCYMLLLTFSAALINLAVMICYRVRCEPLSLMPNSQFQA